MAIFTKHSEVSSITSDELIHQWVVLLPSMTDTISSTSGKCSYMRQIGKVVLEAFQNHSLLELPFSPADESHKATKTGAQFLAYHGLIAESITVDEVSDNKKKWISFVGDQGWHVSREWLMSHEEGTSGTTALILRGCSQQSPILSKLNHVLPKLCFLCVLDLSYTPLKSLPPAIGCLQILRLLSLRGCHDLKTLSSSSTTSATDSTKNTSSPLSTLYHLEILDLNGVPLSHITQDVANQKRNFIHLDMSHSEITTFPSKFFQHMSNLDELIVVNFCKLVELPPSMVALSSLTTLEITGTQIKYFPEKIFEEMQKLQSLKLIDNSNLISLSRPFSMVHEIKLEEHPNLKSFSLIGARHIQCLSLRGCRKLEFVEFKNLCSLEELDLSSTAIKELPANILNSAQLRRLLLLGVPSLLRFPWHMLERLPEVFYLDQCIEGNGNHSDQVSQLCVSDPSFFYSFGESCVDLVRAGRFFQSFYVRVAPCSTKNMRFQREEGIVDNKLWEFLQNQSTYVDVCGSYYAEEITIVSPITMPLRQSERHVEITGMQRQLEGLSSLLKLTKSISVTCDTSIRVFYDREYHIQDLEECELRWCHKMKKVFTDIYSNIENLRNVHIHNLKSLVWFCSRWCYFAFSSLEHLHLEYCPRMKAVTTDVVTLPRLKTLDILFCYNLKNIFFESTWNVRMYQLPSLQRVRLQELPLLQHFHKGSTLVAPMWKELHIRGCWSLRCLPHLQDQLHVLKVNGESRWWSNLQWGSSSHRGSYEPKLPPKFASFDERMEVTSYLR
jgi:Leucine-rich repeat (LRR) protein